MATAATSGRVPMRLEAAVTATIGAGAGLPLGVAFGRTLWDVFARKLYVVPAPAVPMPEFMRSGR